jgi:DNA-binding transcriptional regulator GbsR (MarR family)
MPTRRPSEPDDAHQALVATQDDIADIFGDIAAFWGFTKTQGRIYGLLFVSPDPLSHSEIRDRLGISAGSTSMTLASLVSWGVLQRHDRVYAAETDMWKVITGVFRRRERDQVVTAIDRTRRVLDRLGAVDAPSDALAFARQRVEQLSEFFELGRRFLDAFVARNPVAGLLSTIAQRAAKFRPRSENDVRIGT